MVIRRIDAFSAGKVFGVLYAMLGLVFGLIFSLFSLMGAAIGAGMEQGGVEGAAFSLIFGIGAVVVMPLFYGVMGFVTALVGALLYNLTAGFVGGIRLDLA